MNEEKEKFTESELVVGGLGALLIDGVCGAIDFVSAGISAVITPVAQLAATGAIEWWISQKGGDLGIIDVKRMGKYASNLIPVITTVFFIFLISAFIHNHPEITEVAEKSAGPAGKLNKLA